MFEVLLKRSARTAVRSHTEEVESHPLFRGERKKPLSEPIAADRNKDAATSEKWKPRVGLVSSLHSAASLPALRAKHRAIGLDIIPLNCECMAEGWRRLCTVILTSIQPCQCMWAPSPPTLAPHHWLLVLTLKIWWPNCLCFCCLT